jgi:hypothetical protein
MKHVLSLLLALGVVTLVACKSQEDKAPQQTDAVSDARTVTLNVPLM